MLQEVESTMDEELLLLILKSHLVARVVNTSYYNHLISYILSSQKTDQETPYYLSADTIANQLQEAGYQAEAGSLLLQHNGTHPQVQIFDTAIGYLSSWFSK